MSSSRRDFLTAAVLAGLGGSAIELRAQGAPAMPTERARALMTLFGLRYPIFSAGMGATAIPELAVAISNAGGLGAVGTGVNHTPDLVRRRVSQAKAATNRPFAVNYLLAREPVTLPLALDLGAPIIQFAWGIPTSDTVGTVRKAGAKMGIQISNAGGARRAVDLGADYLICQGTEAGGHVQATRPLYDVLAAVIDEAKTVPVLAAGGIANGADIRRALLAGASGVLVGTRLVATREAGCHEEYKAALTRANASDTVMTTCFQDGWNAPARVLRNRTIEMWEAAGCPAPGARPGEGDVIATNQATGATVRRYATVNPSPDHRGELLEMALWAGTGVERVRDVPPAGELIARLWKECLEAA